jgi:hypothetical protein
MSRRRPLRELKFLSQPFPRAQKAEQAAVPNFFIVVLILAIWRHDARGVVCHHSISTERTMQRPRLICTRGFNDAR